MKTIKNILWGMLMQAVILAIHIPIHLFQTNNSASEQHLQILFSFLSVILITYFVVLFLKLPVYTILTAQIITVLFILIFEIDGFYLVYYLHKGSSQWFDPNKYTDSAFITLEMLVIQLATVPLVKLTQYIVKKRVTKDDSN